jgi:hypothetical protein
MSMHTIVLTGMVALAGLTGLAALAPTDLDAAALDEDGTCQSEDCATELVQLRASAKKTEGAIETLQEKKLSSPQWERYSWLQASIGATPGVTMRGHGNNREGTVTAHITTPDDAAGIQQACVLNETLRPTVTDDPSETFGTLYVQVDTSSNCSSPLKSDASALNATFAGNPYFYGAFALPNMFQPDLFTMNFCMKPMVTQAYTDDLASPWSLSTRTSQQAFMEFLIPDIAVTTLPSEIYRQDHDEISLQAEVSRQSSAPEVSNESNVCHHYCDLGHDICSQLSTLNYNGDPWVGNVDHEETCAPGAECFSLTAQGGPAGSGATLRGCMNPPNSCESYGQVAASMGSTVTSCEVGVISNICHQFCDLGDALCAAISSGTPGVDPWVGNVNHQDECNPGAQCFEMRAQGGIAGDGASVRGCMHAPNSCASYNATAASMGATVTSCTVSHGAGHLR